MGRVGQTAQLTRGLGYSLGDGRFSDGVQGDETAVHCVAVLVLVFLRLGF